MFNLNLTTELKLKTHTKLLIITEVNERQWMGHFFPIQTHPEQSCHFEENVYNITKYEK